VPLRKPWPCDVIGLVPSFLVLYHGCSSPLPAISPCLAASDHHTPHDINGDAVRMPTLICCRTFRLRRGVVPAATRQPAVSEGSLGPKPPFQRVVRRGVLQTPSRDASAPSWGDACTAVRRAADAQKIAIDMELNTSSSDNGSWGAPPPRWQCAQSECSSAALLTSCATGACALAASHHAIDPITRMQVHAPESLALTAVSSLAASNVPVRASDLNQRPGVFHNQPWPPPQLGRCKTLCHYLCVSFHTFAFLTLPASRVLRELDALFAACPLPHSLQVTRFLLLLLSCRTASSANTGSIYSTVSLNRLSGLAVAYPFSVGGAIFSYGCRLSCIEATLNM
jgi:hypothetical protein